MKTKWRVAFASRLMLAACLAMGVLCAQARLTGAASTASSSTWYWQNPLPHPYLVNAVACTSATHCVAVGTAMTALRTSDGGRHWTAGSGPGLNVYAVSCPSRVACYALGYDGLGARYLVKSVDGGATWQETPFDAQYPSQNIAFTCPSATTCLVSDSLSGGDSHVLRTTDGGQTWANVFERPFIGSVSCASRLVCYAGTDNTAPFSSGTPRTHTVYRSEDAGRTWTPFAQSQVDPDAVVGALSCSAAGFCLAALDTRLPDGAAPAYAADLFLIEQVSATWIRADHVTQIGFGSATCTGTATCNYLFFYRSAHALRTTNGGKTWTSIALPTDPSGSLTCPNARTCYVPSGFTVVTTTDGFHHIAETPARNPIGHRSLDTIRCPTGNTCYAYGGTSLVATTNGGHTWATRPDLPWTMGLACPSSSVCYGLRSRGLNTPVALYRTGDRALHWQQLNVPITKGVPFGLSCPAVATCYVGINRYVDGARHAAILVTRDGGSRWILNTTLESVATNVPNGSSFDSLSCPSVTTCFAEIPTPDSTGSGSPPVLMETRDGGQRWTLVRSFEGTIGSFDGPPGPLTCPNVTTCYAVSQLNQVHAAIVSTHDGGATWHRKGFGPHLVIDSIACATAEACRVVTQSVVYATTDGGKTWHQQPLPMGGLGISGIACPGVDTCYAVGGMNILATHRL